MTRNTSPPGLTQNAVQQAFALPKGGATSAPTADGKARIILRVADIIPAPAADRRADRAPQDRAGAPDAAATCWPSMSRGLQARYGLSVNDAALKQALGTAATRADRTSEPPSVLRQDRSA